MINLKWNNLNSEEFELLCYDILSKIGFKNIDWYKGPLDRGRDIIARKNIDVLPGKSESTIWIIECKHYTSRGISVKDLVTSKGWADSLSDEIDYLLIMTSGHLTVSTKDWLNKLNSTGGQNYKIEYLEKIDLENILLGNPSLLKKYFPYSLDRAVSDYVNNLDLKATILDFMSKCDPMDTLKQKSEISKEIAKLKDEELKIVIKELIKLSKDENKTVNAGVAMIIGEIHNVIPKSLINPIIDTLIYLIYQENVAHHEIVMMSKIAFERIKNIIPPEKIPEIIERLTEYAKKPDCFFRYSFLETLAELAPIMSESQLEIIAEIHMEFLDEFEGTKEGFDIFELLHSINNMAEYIPLNKKREFFEKISQYVENKEACVCALEILTKLSKNGDEELKKQLLSLFVPLLDNKSIRDEILYNLSEIPQIPEEISNEIVDKLINFIKNRKISRDDLDCAIDIFFENLLITDDEKCKIWENLISITKKRKEYLSILIEKADILISDNPILVQECQSSVVDLIAMGYKSKNIETQRNTLFLLEKYIDNHDHNDDVDDIIILLEKNLGGDIHFNELYSYKILLQLKTMFPNKIRDEHVLNFVSYLIDNYCYFDDFEKDIVDASVLLIDNVKQNISNQQRALLNKKIIDLKKIIDN